MRALQNERCIQFYTSSSESFKQVGKEVTTEWESCGMLQTTCLEPFTGKHGHMLQVMVT